MGTYKVSESVIESQPLGWVSQGYFKKNNNPISYPISKDGDQKAAIGGALIVAQW